MTYKARCGCRYTDSRDRLVREGYTLSGYLEEECEKHKAEREAKAAQRQAGDRSASSCLLRARNKLVELQQFTDGAIKEGIAEAQQNIEWAAQDLTRR